jgi:hypothetical protein
MAPSFDRIYRIHGISSHRLSCKSCESCPKNINAFALQLGGIDGILVRHSYSQLGVAYNSWPSQIVIANLLLQDDIASRSSPGLVDRGKAEATLNYARPPYPRRQVSGQS